MKEYSLIYEIHEIRNMQSQLELKSNTQMKRSDMTTEQLYSILCSYVQKYDDLLQDVGNLNIPNKDRVIQMIYGNKADLAEFQKRIKLLRGTEKEVISAKYFFDKGDGSEEAFQYEYKVITNHIAYLRG